MRSALFLIAALALTACSSPIPNSAGVGFGDYDQYQAERQARDAALRGDPTPQAGVISNEPLSVIRTAEAPSESAQIAADTRAALNQTLGAPQAQTQTRTGLSDEQDFEAVAARESIESDRERLQQQRAQFEQVAPEALPNRPSDAGPNIVEYALSTSHPPGTQRYNRSRLFNRNARNCNRYSNANEAQEAFLAAGGPQRDRQGLDPDGDGYACGWDPTPFRLAARN